MVFKGLFAFGAGIAGLCAVSETVARQVDRRVWRPIRNYHAGMVQLGTFNMPEDFWRMTDEVKKGVKTLALPDDD